MIYIIKKGDHFSSPRTPKALVRQVNGQVKFTAANYNLDGGDQFDWNKLTGISFNPLNPSRDAVMIGWRWNNLTNKIQLGAYFNVKGQNIYPELNMSPIMEVSQTELVTFKIDYNQVVITSTIQNKSITIPVPQGMFKSWLTSFRIQPYFGGNRSAPNYIEINLSFS
jgi:hypothetical protein